MADESEVDPEVKKSLRRNSNQTEVPPVLAVQDAAISCRPPSPCNHLACPKSPTSQSATPLLPDPNPVDTGSTSPRLLSPMSPSPTYQAAALREDSDDCLCAQYDTSDIASSESSKLRKDSPEENFRRGNRIYRTLTFRRKKSAEAEIPEVCGDSKKSRKYWWSFRFKKKLLQSSRTGKSSAKCSPSTETQNLETPSCVCMGYKRTEEYAFASDLHHKPAESSVVRSSEDSDSESDIENAESVTPKLVSAKKVPVLDMSKFNPEDYPVDDPDEVRIAQRARDMAEGIDVPPNFPYNSALAAAVSSRDVSSHDAQVVTDLSDDLESHCVVTTTYPTVSPVPGVSLSSESHYSEYGSLTPQGTYVPHTIHTQVDYIHCLVPDLHAITNCSFYWGIMDRYEAEKLLDTKPEGTFLLRDSAQEEFLFSVSFRRYGRSLHARIEQWNHLFSFDSHDPGVFSSDTVCGLIEHYKDPSCCMFFEPMLTLPLNRNFPFSLQHMCRSVIGNRTSYDGINRLPLPKALKEYLQYYHYKQKVRVRRFEVH